MRRVGQREGQAFETLYASYHRVIFAIGLRLLGDAASAEDLTQSVFLKVWSNPRAFKGGSFAAWVSRVARNRGLDMLRKRSLLGQTHVAAGIPAEVRFENEAVAGIDFTQVRDALARLPSRERVPIELGYFRGLTQRSVALETGVPLGTVKTRVRTGLHRMRRALSER